MYPLGYGEGLNDARTLLADFLSTLLERRGWGVAGGAEAKSLRPPALLIFLNPSGFPAPTSSHFAKPS